VIDTYDWRNAHRSSSEEKFVTNVEFAAVDWSLCRSQAELSLRQLHYGTARDAFKNESKKQGEAASYTAPNGSEIKLEVVEAKPFAS